MKYRIDIEQEGVWHEGQITFHDQTPISALENVAAQLQAILHRPTRIVRVYETHREYVETVLVFDGTTAEEAAPTGA